MFKKVLGIGLTASLLIGAPAFAAVDSTNDGNSTSTTINSEKTQLITVTGTLEREGMCYIPGMVGEMPLYTFKVVTESGEVYYLQGTDEKSGYEIYEGTTVTVRGFLNGINISNSTIINSEKAQLITVTGTLEREGMCYIPGMVGEMPIYTFKVVTESGEVYYLQGTDENSGYEIYEGKTVTVKGSVNGIDISNFSLHVSK